MTSPGDSDDTETPQPQLLAPFLVGAKGPRRAAATSPADSLPMSLLPAALLGLLVCFAFVLVTGIEESIRPVRGTNFWSVIFGSDVHQALAVPGLQDAVAWTIVLVAAAGPLYLARTCRLSFRLFEAFSFDGISEAQSKSVGQAFARFNASIKVAGSRFVSGSLSVGCAASAFVLVRYLERLGPWRGVLERVPVSGGSQATRVSALTHDWWLNAHRHPVTAWTFGLIVSFYLFTAVKQLILGGALLLLVYRVRSVRLEVPIDERDTDGHHGLRRIRQVLFLVVAEALSYLVTSSAVLFIWIGAHPFTVALGATFALLALLSLATPMFLLTEAIERGKRRQLTYISNHLRQIEQNIPKAIGLLDTKTDGDVPALEYWRWLRERQAAIHDIPSSGFRYREFIYSATTMLIVPALLLVVGALASRA